MTQQALRPDEGKDRIPFALLTARPRTWRHKLQRGVTICREEGMKSLWIKLLRGVGAARWELLWERPLDVPLENVTPKVSVQIEVLDQTHVVDYLQFRHDANPTDIGQRLTDGQWCFVARHQGQIVHADWIVTDRAWLAYLACELPLAPDEVYSYDSFTTPEFRGQNIAAARSVYMQRTMQERGYTRVVTMTLPDNQAAIRMHERAGYRRLGSIGYVQLGPWRRHFFRIRGRAHPLGSLQNERPSGAPPNEV